MDLNGNHREVEGNIEAVRDMLEKRIGTDEEKDA